MLNTQKIQYFLQTAERGCRSWLVASPRTASDTNCLEIKGVCRNCFFCFFTHNKKTFTSFGKWNNQIYKEKNELIWAHTKRWTIWAGAISQKRELERRTGKMLNEEALWSVCKSERRGLLTLQLNNWRRYDWEFQ